MGFESVYRRALLGLSGVPIVERTLRARGMKLGVRRFVAGETAAEAVAAARALETDGFLVILDLLGEYVAGEEAATAMTEQILEVIDRLAVLGSPALSVKPTQIGLGLGLGVASRNAYRVAEAAAARGVHITFDMENHPFVDGTIALYRLLREAGFTGVGTVLQSYLRRSERDLESLLELEPMPTLRIVKGAYREPARVAYQDRERIDEQYLKLLFRLLDAGGEAHVATHDERLLREAEEYIENQGVGRERYQMQFLYGVSPALQRSLRDRNHPVRIYVPFGRDWYGYFSRRLAERPANLAFVVRGLFS